jgi:hypothetical protein
LLWRLLLADKIQQCSIAIASLQFVN